MPDGASERDHEGRESRNAGISKAEATKGGREEGEREGSRWKRGLRGDATKEVGGCVDEMRDEGGVPVKEGGRVASGKGKVDIREEEVGDGRKGTGTED